MYDQLGKRTIEVVVRKGKVLGNSRLYVDLRKALVDCRDERGRRIDRRGRVRAQPLNQLCSQRSGSAPDVQDPLPCPYVGLLGEPFGQWLGIPTHEPAVGIRGDVEGHSPNIGPSDL